MGSNLLGSLSSKFHSFTFKNCISFIRWEELVELLFFIYLSPFFSLCYICSYGIHDVWHFLLMHHDDIRQPVSFSNLIRSQIDEWIKKLHNRKLVK